MKQKSESRNIVISLRLSNKILLDIEKTIDNLSNKYHRLRRTEYIRQCIITCLKKDCNI